MRATIAKNEPKGVAFYSIKSGDTHHAKSQAQIQAYINSSDMGINASRGQDFGWRLAKDWVEAIREFKQDTNKMAVLAARNNGNKVTDVQVLYAIYREQLRVFRQIREDNENPFEEKYLQDISRKQPKEEKEPEDKASTKK